MRRHERVRATPAWSDSSGVTATPNFEPTARARGMEAAASSMAHVEGQVPPPNSLVGELIRIKS
jgi:hypothetical protein